VTCSFVLPTTFSWSNWFIGPNGTQVPPVSQFVPSRATVTKSSASEGSLAEPYVNWWRNVLGSFSSVTAELLLYVYVSRSWACDCVSSLSIVRARRPTAS
jgi:hypothetical protein